MSAPPLPKTPSNTSGAAAADSVDVGAEIVTYAAPFNVYGLAWATRPFTLAAASFVEDYTNKVEIIALNKSGEFVRRCSFDHSYPATKGKMHLKKQLQMSNCSCCCIIIVFEFYWIYIII